MGFMNQILKLGIASLIGKILAGVRNATSYAFTTAPPLSMPAQITIAVIKTTSDKFLIVQIIALQALPI